MLALDLSETQEVEVHGAKWTVGVVPWGKLAALRIAVGQAYDARAAALAARNRANEAGDEAAAHKAGGDILSTNNAYLEVAGEIVRWGVRSTPIERLNAVPHGVEKFAGRDCQVLAPEVVDTILRVAPPEGEHVRLVDALAARVLTCNDVSHEDLLGFK